jgi:hypothetical protein
MLIVMQIQGNPGAIFETAILSHKCSVAVTEGWVQLGLFSWLLMATLESHNRVDESMSL